MATLESLQEDGPERPKGPEKSSGEAMGVKVKTGLW